MERKRRMKSKEIKGTVNKGSKKKTVKKKH